MNQQDQNANPLLSEFSDDQEMGELIELFVAEMPVKIEALMKAFETGATDDLTRLAHQLKGAAAGYGFPTIGAAAADLEQTSREIDDIQRVKNELDGLINECNRATF
jgi:HPt (histidine-containing phosphotransfer) domain-containing protein